jgi:hypothetical protein
MLRINDANLESYNNCAKQTAALEDKVARLEAEIKTLRWTINPNTLERLIQHGKIPLGDGVLPWVNREDRFGLSRLLSNVEVGNDKLAPGLAEELADRAAEPGTGKEVPYES